MTDPDSIPGFLSRHAWLRWILACAVGAVGFGNVADNASRSASDFAGMSFAWLVSGVVVGGVTLGGTYTPE